MAVRTGRGFYEFSVRKHRGVSKGDGQGYLGFLGLLLNERGRWFALPLSDHLGR